MTAVEAECTCDSPMWVLNIITLPQWLSQVELDICTMCYAPYLWDFTITPTRTYFSLWPPFQEKSQWTPSSVRLFWWPRPPVRRLNAQSTLLGFKLRRLNALNTLLGFKLRNSRDLQSRVGLLEVPCLYIKCLSLECQQHHFLRCGFKR